MKYNKIAIIAISCLVLSSCGNKNNDKIVDNVNYNKESAIKENITKKDNTDSIKEENIVDDKKDNTEEEQTKTESDDKIAKNNIDIKSTESENNNDSIFLIDNTKLSREYILEVSELDIVKDSDANVIFKIDNINTEDIEIASLNIKLNDKEANYIKEFSKENNMLYTEYRPDTKERGGQEYFAIIKSKDGSVVRTEFKELFIYEPITDEQKQWYNEVQEKIDNLLSSEEYNSKGTNDEKAELIKEVLKEYKDRGWVKDYERGGYPDSVWYEMESGIYTMVMIDGWGEDTDGEQLK